MRASWRPCCVACQLLNLHTHCEIWNRAYFNDVFFFFKSVCNCLVPKYPGTQVPLSLVPWYPSTLSLAPWYPSTLVPKYPCPVAATSLKITQSRFGATFWGRICLILGVRPLPTWFGALFPRWSAPECPFECGGRGAKAIWAMPKCLLRFLMWAFPYRPQG